jgi:WD40 repeat protein
MINFSENGFTLAVGSSVGKVIKIFDLRKAKCVKTIPSALLASLSFDLSGNILAIGSKSGQISLVETKKWSEVAAFTSHASDVTAIK